jgi:hypothetical protein
LENELQRLAVDHQTVCIMQRAQDLARHIERERGGQPLAGAAQRIEQRLQVHAVDQLQRHVVRAVGLAEVVHLDDGRIAQLGEQPRLVEEQLHEARIGSAARQDALEADPLFEARRAPAHGDEGLGHAACPKRA